MAHRQVVMMGCIENHVTPRVRVKDDFSAVLVSGLGIGDEVRMLDDSTSTEYVLPSGLSPIPTPRPEAIRFRKVAGSEPRPTSIEIHRGS